MRQTFSRYPLCLHLSGSEYLHVSAQLGLSEEMLLIPEVKVLELKPSAPIQRLTKLIFSELPTALSQMFAFSKGGFPILLLG